MTEPREALAASDLSAIEGVCAVNVGSLRAGPMAREIADALNRSLAAGVHLGDEGLRTLDGLPRVRLTGAQLHDIDPDPEAHAWVDWDEYEELSLADVRAALTEGDSR